MNLRVLARIAAAVIGIVGILAFAGLCFLIDFGVSCKRRADEPLSEMAREDVQVLTIVTIGVAIVTIVLVTILLRWAHSKTLERTPEK